MEKKGYRRRATDAGCSQMEVDAASLELVCAVWVVQQDVPAERLARGTAVPVVVADVVASVRRWVLSGGEDPQGPLQKTKFERAMMVLDWEGVRFCQGEMAQEQRQAVMRDALMGCARGGYLAILRWLVEEGGDIHALNDLAPQWSIYEDHLDVVEWLVSTESGIEWTAAAMRRLLEDAPHPGEMRTILQAAVVRLAGRDPSITVKRG